MEFIINQILINSIKYSKGKDDKIQIESKEISNTVVLTIEDEGVGIIERDLDRVFEKGFTGEVNIGTNISTIFPKAENLVEK